MITVTGSLLGFALLLGLMASGIHVATTMFIVSFLGGVVFLGPNILASFGVQLWSTMNDYILTSIPLFVLMGELLLRSGITTRMYASLSDWLSRMPGGLLHTNIGASALFSAISGSSVATAATIGSVAIPELAKRDYDERWVLGTIAAGGTLGILIPPSVNLIIYGAMTDTSVSALFAAGVVPGLVLTVFFMTSVAVASLLRPNFAGSATENAPLAEKLRRLSGLLPPVTIIVIVVGAIYGGYATPTEAAAIGVVLATLLALFTRNLTVAMLHDAFIATVKMSALILLILSAAFYLSFITNIIGVPQVMSQIITNSHLGPIGVLWLLVIFYLVLGCFLETMSMMVATIPIIFPIITHLGIDPVWFGIFLVLMMELALITPPVGMNLYVVQGVRKGGNMHDLFIGVLPFIGALLALVAAIIYLPEIVTYLPGLL